MGGCSEPVGSSLPASLKYLVRQQPGGGADPDPEGGGVEAEASADEWRADGATWVGR